MNNVESINLKKLLDQTDWEDNTVNIRRIKHSTKIRDDVRQIENLKVSWDGSGDFIELCQSKCTFLYNNYTDIFNKAVKNELDLTIMTKLLTVLKMIEDEKLDQHNASVMVGKVLKELYVDSAMKRMDNLDKENTQEQVPKVEPKKISWRDYKLQTT
jgi:ATP-dependent helicase/DNAse subunit B